MITSFMIGGNSSSSMVGIFSEIAPNLGMLFRVTDSSSLYINLARGFRAPQITEMYRLQSGQQALRGNQKPATSN